jgi:hypothetical protein
MASVFAPEKTVMSRLRFRVVFILLILILLIASALFGVLTYWLEGEPPPVSGSRGGEWALLCGVSRSEMKSLADGLKVK